MTRPFYIIFSQLPAGKREIYQRNPSCNGESRDGSRKKIA
jgi:hypothetical protein